MWEAIARLIGDEESAHELHLQLEGAMVSSAIEEVLSDEHRRIQHVESASGKVAVELDELRLNPSDDEQHLLCYGDYPESSVFAARLAVPVVCGPHRPAPRASHCGRPPGSMGDWADGIGILAKKAPNHLTLVG